MLITSKIKRPNKDWDKFVITHKAKSEIHKWFNNEKRLRIEKGREMWEKKLRKSKYTLTEDELIKLLGRLKFESIQHFYHSIGEEKVEVDEIFEIIKDRNKLLSGEIHSPWVRTLERSVTSREKESQSNLFDNYLRSARASKSKIIAGGDVKDLAFSYANCCNPIPGEDIIGFVTKSEGIKIHKKSCKNLSNLFLTDPARIIDVQWPAELDDEFFVGIRINGEDKQGMLNEITQVISSYNNTNIKSVNIASKGFTFEGTVILKVRNITHLKELIDKVKSIDGVYDVRRFEET